MRERNLTISVRANHRGERGHVAAEPIEPQTNILQYRQTGQLGRNGAVQIVLKRGEMRHLREQTELARQRADETVAAQVEILQRRHQPKLRWHDNVWCKLVPKNVKLPHGGQLPQRREVESRTVQFDILINSNGRDKSIRAFKSGRIN